MDDVLHLIFATRGNLDWDRMLSKIDDYWELLHFYRYVYPNHTHYLPQWVLQALLGRYEEEYGAASDGPLRLCLRGLRTPRAL